MYENMTPEKLREEILNGSGTEISTNEGSFASDMAAPVALGMSNAYGQLDKLLALMFIQTIDRDYLEARAGEFGIVRKAGAKASGTIRVSGSNGSILPAGAAVMTEDNLIFYTDREAVIASGTASVGITAAKIGHSYNVAAGEIKKLYRNYVGISGVWNEAPTLGGIDDETDEALRDRLLIRIQTPATSGNAYHYRMWALESAGVGAAKVYPLWNGNGTVKVMVVGDDMQPVDETIVTACAEYIESVRPIGATVTVVSAVAKAISVDAVVVIDTSTTISEVQEAFYKALEEYIHEIAFEVYTLSYNKVGYLLMSIPGVVDYTALTVNGGTENVTIDAGEVPVLGEVTIGA